MPVQIDRMRSAANAPCTIRSGIIVIQLQRAAVCQPILDRLTDIIIGRAADCCLDAGLVAVGAAAVLVDFVVGALYDLDVGDRTTMLYCAAAA
mgnify:CR=1 FL=1